MNIVLHFDLNSPAFSIWILAGFLHALYLFYLNFSSNFFQNTSKLTLAFNFIFFKIKTNSKYFRFPDKNWLNSVCLTKPLEWSLENSAAVCIFLIRKTPNAVFFGVLQMTAEFFKNFLTRILQDRNSDCKIRWLQLLHSHFFNDTFAQ